MSDTVPVDAAFSAMMQPYAITERLLALLQQQSAFQISPVDFSVHGVQMAARALRAGWSEEWIVGALLHDLGEHLIPNGHGEIAASLLRPYVTPELHWVLAHHEIFQFVHYGHAYGASDTKAPSRRFLNHRYYNATIAFCVLDEESFDRRLATPPLELFAPMVRRVISRPPYWWAAETRWADDVDDTVAAKMDLQGAYPGAAPLPLHDPPPAAAAWEQGDKVFVPARVPVSDILHSDDGVRAALAAWHTHGIAILEGLPTEDEEAWVNATRAVFVRLLPASARKQPETAVGPHAYWHTGDASVPAFNDYTNEGRRVTISAADGGPTGTEHPGWYGGELLLHQDGCYLDEPPRLKLYAPWGEPAVSSFTDGLAAVESLAPEHVRALRESSVTVTYEGKHATTQPVLRAPGGTHMMCWNPGDACEVDRNGTDAAGLAALDALGAALEAPKLRVEARTGLAFLVDNARVLHGRVGQVDGRRRVTGGESPAHAVAERWAEVAAVVVA